MGWTAAWLRVGIGSPSFHKRPFVLAVGRAGKSAVDTSAGVFCFVLERLLGDGERVRSALTEVVGLFSRFLAGEKSSPPGSPLGGGSWGTRKASSLALSLLGSCRGWSFAEDVGAVVSLVSVGAAWSLQKSQLVTARFDGVATHFLACRRK